MVPKPFQGRHYLALETQGGLVNQEESRTEGLGCGQDDVLADGQGHGGLDLDGVRQVEIVAVLDHAGDAHKIDAVGKIESAHYGGTGQDDDIVLIDQDVLGQGHGAPDMAQAVGVVRIHEDIHEWP